MKFYNLFARLHQSKNYYKRMQSTLCSYHKFPPDCHTHFKNIVHERTIICNYKTGQIVRGLRYSVAANQVTQNNNEISTPQNLKTKSSDLKKLFSLAKPEAKRLTGF